jgi:hypothetical protein
MAEHTEEGLSNISDIDQTFNGSLSASEIIINRKLSKLRTQRKLTKSTVKRV